MINLNLILNQAENRFVSVTFEKKDGSVRKINGRFNVTKHLKGGTCTLDKDKFFIIYSIADKGYRAIDKDKIKAISIDGLIVYNTAALGRS